MEATPGEGRTPGKSRCRMQTTYKHVTQPRGWVIHLLTTQLKVFFPGGHAAADMALGFVAFQKLPYLLIEELVILGQTL